jgi:hypothetical protein
LISFILVGVIFTPICNSTIIKVNEKQISKTLINPKKPEIGQGTEFWALLVAVGVYYNHPDQDRPEMLDSVDFLYDTLLDSPNYWQADHIHVLKADQATTYNLIKELIWLIRHEDKDDYSLVYITTHGFPLTRNGRPWDIFPWDEADGDDEALVMHYGFERFDHVTDDMLKFFFRFLQSKGLCVIIDSCFAGGFKDPLKINNLIKFNKQKIGNTNSIVNNFDSSEYTQDMAGELAAKGRVVLMSSTEEQKSYSSIFSELIIIGFMGEADLEGNKDGINSAEEAFDFAYPWIVYFTYGYQQPTIVDRYDGDFPITHI